ncbi:MAG: hypothetical protein HY270_03585 [Deltaproteobacteria bacterium]|nr:hypothetical protein [Deltaproteobacteria bacterium]
MSHIYRAFERHLTDLQIRYAGHPEREMLRLALLSLEREENVATAYDEQVLGRRLAALPLPDEIRKLFRTALQRVWKDEEMHATYIHAALLKLGSPVVAARAFLQQIAGELGGWAVAVRQHRHWTEAPLSRSAATLLTWAGWLSGRVPREVRHHLDYCSFHDFCTYNVQTEGTAWLCWQRLTQLAEASTALPGVRVDDLRRIADDEDRHRRVFSILAESLTDDDRLRSAVSEENLAARLGEVGDLFLPPKRWRSTTIESSVAGDAAA